MSNKFLLVVEGEKTEPNVFSKILEQYGYNVISCEEKLDFEDLNQFVKYDYDNGKNNVVIIQGTRNRIHDMLKIYKENEYSFEKMLSMHGDFFQGIFLMYDVDHNDCEDLEEMYHRFPDESSGLLLLSSPCIEVLGDYDLSRGECKYNHLEEYKKELNKHYNNNKTSTCDYIVKNFERLCLYYLDKNKKDFDDTNIMNHPQLIMDYVNKYNERVNFSGEKRKESYVIIRYYSTVIYVFIAFINGLTRKIDNYEIVRDWFLNHKVSSD